MRKLRHLDVHALGAMTHVADESASFMIYCQINSCNLHSMFLVTMQLLKIAHELSNVCG